MSEREFWSITPRRFGALQDRFLEGEQRKDARAGQIVSMIYNVNRGKNKRAMYAKDFFPSLKRIRAKRKIQSEGEQLAFMMAFAQAYNEKIARD